MALVIAEIGGLCPVQAEGEVDGVPFYFRARHEHWCMSIGEDPVGIHCGKPGWRRESEWGDGPYAAGFMPVDVAVRIIEECAEEWRNEQEVV